MSGAATDAILVNAIQLAFFVLTLIVTVFGTPILLKVYRKAGLSEEQARIAVEQTKELAERMKLRNLLIGVEEWAASKIKAGESVNAAMKTDKLLIDATDAGFTDMAKVFDWARQELPKLGLGAAGAQRVPVPPPVAVVQ